MMQCAQCKIQSKLDGTESIKNTLLPRLHVMLLSYRICKGAVLMPLHNAPSKKGLGCTVAFQKIW